MGFIETSTYEIMGKTYNEIIVYKESMLSDYADKKSPRKGINRVFSLTTSNDIKMFHMGYKDMRVAGDSVDYGELNKEIYITVLHKGQRIAVLYLPKAVSRKNLIEVMNWVDEELDKWKNQET